jgi:BirA family biotin operon repressor/biotin-[acetyl-CoA-carboxylase] ligase
MFLHSLGYLLMPMPAHPSRPRFQVQIFDRLPSTNAYAQGLLAQNPPDRTVIWAMDQFAGRGQQGNHWRSEAGSNLTLSVIVHPQLPVSELFVLSKLSALAMKATAEAYAPQALVQVKWPNDLLVNGRKVGGILIENQLQGHQVVSAILGLGLNVNQQVFPAEIAARSSSLSREAGQPLDLQSVCDTLLAELDQQLVLVEQGYFDQLDRAYRSHLYGYHETIRVEIDGQVSQRLLVGVSPTGQLALAHEGQVQYFDVKAVRLLLPLE